MIQAIYINKNGSTNVLYNLTEYNFIYRKYIKNTINVVFDEISKNLDYDNKYMSNVNESMNYYNHEKFKDNIIIVYQNANTKIFIISDKQLNGHQLTMLKINRKINKINTTSEEIQYVKKIFIDFDSEIDKIDIIDKKINDAKEIAILSIDALFQRGDKLEDLLIQSNEVDELSKAFIKDSKKLNRCWGMNSCTIL